MKEQDNIKAAFTAYAATAIKNAKVRYMKKKYKIEKHEVVYEISGTLSDSGTEDIFRKMDLATQQVYKGTMEMRFLLDQIGDSRLLHVIINLTKLQKEVILLRVFYEKSFSDIGARLGMPAKKAENTYYNVMKKIRKNLEDKR